MASAVYSDLDFRKAFAAVSVSQAFSHPPSQSISLITSPQVPATPVNTPASNMSTAPSSPPFVPTTTPVMEVPSPLSDPSSPCPAPNNTPASNMSPIWGGVAGASSLEELSHDSPQLQATVPPNSPDTLATESGVQDLRSQEFQDGYVNLGERLAALGLGRKRAVSTALPQTQAAAPKAPKAPDGNEYYDIKAIPGKGYGCITRQFIKCGTRILADSPLLFVKPAYYYLSDVQAEFEKLSPEDKKLYFSLHSAHGQDPKNWPSKGAHASVPAHESKKIEEEHKARLAKDPSVLSIFQTNCMEKDGGSAVFPNTARFNHSCNPNACFTWNPAIGKETIHVIRDIKPGEEITIAYCDITHSKALRRWELKHYGFFCDCPACADDNGPESWAVKSAARRYRLHELEEATEPFRGRCLDQGVEKPELVEQLLEIAKLRREEGDYTPILANAYIDLAFICEFKGDLEFAKKAAEMALKIRLDCNGPEFPCIADYFTMVKRIKEKIEAKKKRNGGELDEVE